MRNLNQQYLAVPKWALATLIITAFIGFADATYLTAEHFLNRVPPCSIIKGCEVVTTSKYATIGNMPIALLGAIYYFFMFILLMLFVDTKKNNALMLFARLSIIGLLTSAYLIYIQLFTLKAICIYCMLSATTSTILFLLSLYILKINKINLWTKQ